MIRHEGGKWVLYSHDGDTVLGSYDSEDAAKERERQIMAAKHAQGDHMTEAEIKTLIETTIRESGRAEWDRLKSDGLEFVRCADATGTVWEVRVVRFGTSKNGWNWTREAGAQMVPFLKSAPVGLYQFKAGMAHAKEEDVLTADGAIVRNVVGDIQEPRLEADGVYGQLHLHEDAGWLKTKLLGLAKRGLADKVLGLSVDTLAGYVKEGGARVIKEVKRLFSVDIVTAPSADGRFLRATAGLDLGELKEDPMKTALIARIKELKADLLTGTDVEKIGEADLLALYDQAVKAKADQPKEPADLDQKIAERIREAQERQEKIAETQTRVAEALAATKLPELVKARVKRDFKGTLATDEAITARVKEEVDLLGALDKSGEIRGYGEAGRVTMESKDKLQVAMDRLFEIDPARIEECLKRAPMSEGARDRIRDNINAGGPGGGGDWEEHTRPLVKVREAMTADPGLRFKGLRDAYVHLTGDDEVTGRFRKGRVSEALDSTSWAEITANTLYRRLLMDYMEPEYNENSITIYGAAQDFRTKYVTQLGYFGDIAVVDPESADYAEITAVSDDQVSYAISQRGNILTITRKLIINDDLRAISRLVGRLGRAARRTLAKRIWQDNWVSNIAYQVDAVAWFHSNHGNTASTALTADATGAAAVLAAITQLADMTEPGSLEKLGMPPMASLWLDVPHALMGVARRLNLTSYFGTTETNPVQGFFGANGERINVNPLFTDATDWGIHVAPGAAGREVIGVDFLQGRQEPEFFLADMPTVGQMFYGDKIQYKLRHEYATYLSDFRGATKNVVAG